MTTYTPWPPFKLYEMQIMVECMDGAAEERDKTAVIVEVSKSSKIDTETSQNYIT